MKQAKIMRSFRFTADDLKLLKRVREKLDRTHPPEYTAGGKKKKTTQAKALVIGLNSIDAITADAPKKNTRRTRQQSKNG